MNRGKRLVELLARDLSDEAITALKEAVGKDLSLRGMAGLLDAVEKQRVEAPAGGPLITVEASLRFRLECETEKVAQLEEENRELRARLQGDKA